MAPEIGRGEYGREIDLYALGVILYEMLTGRLPFDGETCQEIVIKHLSAEPDLHAIPEPYRHVIGKALGIKPLILGACVHRGFGLDRNSKVFWDGTPIDPEKDPSVVADRLFKGGSAAPPADPSEPSQPNPELALRGELLKLTEAELSDLRGAVLDLTSEQSKLQTHLQSVQSLRASVDSQMGGGAGPGGGGQVVSCTSTPAMPLVEQVRAASAGQVIDSSGGNDYFYQEANFPLIFQAQLQLATQALICGAAPIVGVQPLYTTSEIDFTFAGTPGSHHNTLSHIQAQQAPGYAWDSPASIDNVTPEARAVFGKAQRWFAEQLVEHVVSVLASTDDPTAPGTSVLDNTLIYWTSEISDGFNHLRTSTIEYPQIPCHLPLVTIGGAAGALKTGQVVSFPINDRDEKPQIARPATDLYLTLARAMGASNATFPDTTGVVSEVLA